MNGEIPPEQQAWMHSKAFELTKQFAAQHNLFFVITEIVTSKTFSGYITQ